MPKKRNHRAVAVQRNGRNGAIHADGLIGRFVDRACDNPAMSGGLFVMMLTASAIVSNAMFLQNVRHPEPLFATRPPLIVERHLPSTPPPAPIPRHAEEQTGSIAPPLPRAAPVTTAVAARSAETALVREIQTVLARKGLYLGAIDGVFGNLSRAAISEYQKTEGLPVTGEPSTPLLEHMQMSAAAAPRATPPPVVAAIPPDVPALSAIGDAIAESERLRMERVQTALNRIGYGPVVVDGNADEETANAIRRFELDNGLPISGSAGEQVIDRMVAIGALPAT